MEKRLDNTLNNFKTKINKIKISEEIKKAYNNSVNILLLK
jgi:hypothetical protein